MVHIRVENKTIKLFKVGIPLKKTSSVSRFFNHATWLCLKRETRENRK